MTFQVLDKMEYDLKMIWRQAQASTGPNKEALLNQYRDLHNQYKRTRQRILGQ